MDVDEPSALLPPFVSSPAAVACMRFRGREKLSVDAKGRTSVPARFRNLIRGEADDDPMDQLVLVPWFDPCIRVYPVATWDALQAAYEAEFGGDDIFGVDEDEADFRRFLFGNANDVTLDANGRILLPAHAREHAHIDRDVMWVGIGPGLEVWEPSRYLERIDGERASDIRQRLRRVRRDREASDS